jgi:hypothetical protein
MQDPTNEDTKHRLIALVSRFNMYDNILWVLLLSYNFQSKREESKTKETYFLMSITKVFNSIYILQNKF